MLVVEAVTNASPAETLDIQIHDRLLTYSGQRLLYPAALLALEENTFGAQLVVLRIARAGIETELSIPTGKLGLIVRPELPDDALLDYDRGRAAFEAEQFAEAAQRWSEAAERASEKSVSVWLYKKAGEAWEKVPDWQQARVAYDAAWEGLTGSEASAARSTTAVALGRCHENRSDWEKAVTWYERAEQIDRQAQREMWEARNLNNLGRIAWLRGTLEAAHDYHARALQIQERLAPDSLDAANSVNNLGLVAFRRGDLQAAYDHFKHTLQISERLAPDSLEVAKSLNNLGNVAFQRGDLQAAYDIFERVLQIYERLAPDSLHVATGLNNLGTVAYDRGDLLAAHDYFTSVLQIYERLSPDSLHVATVRNNLGNVAWHRGDLQAAQDYLTRALQIFERLAPNSLEVAYSLNSLGLSAADSGDVQAAHDYYTRALRIFEHLAPNALDCAEALTQLGRILLRQRRPDHALSLLQQAVRILEEQRITITSADARALLLAQHTAKYTALLQGYLAVNQPGDAFCTLERSRARSLLELLTERRLDFVDQAPLDLLQQQQELDRLRAHTYDQLARLSVTEGELEIPALHAQLRDLERKQQQLTAQIRQASPRYASLQYPQPLDCKAAQQALQPGTLLLAFVTAEQQTFLFALTNKTVQTFTIPIDLKSLQKQVRNFRAALNVASMEYSLEEVVQQGKNLYDLLLAPAYAQIKKATRLLLCLDGPLHTLPWAALVTNTDGTSYYLGEWKPLHTTLSMTVYAQMREEEKALGNQRQGAQPTDASSAAGLTSRLLQTSRKLLALGDPIYLGGRRPALARSGASPEQATGEERGVPDASPQRSGTDLHTGQEQALSSVPDAEAAPDEDRELAKLRSHGLTLSRLPHSREEVEGIGRIFGGQAVVRLGAEATKTAALQESADVDILHFACHGWLDAQVPLSSGLILSQPELLGERASEGDNGLLQAWEILSKMRLKAELVVLSACQTALGQEVRGEGLMGLTRAFTYAGANSVLTSLWEINDASTRAFMQHFYSALAAGQGKAEALQCAMRRLRQHKEWQDPFFWSAFLLAGDAD